MHHGAYVEVGSYMGQFSSSNVGSGDSTQVVALEASAFT